jgi:hypothetical protein
VVNDPVTGEVEEEEGLPCRHAMSRIPAPSTAVPRIAGNFGRMSRRCSRSACNEAAVVTLNYRYATATCWVDEVSGEPDPHSYDLCDKHFSRLTVPGGWRLDDRRHRFRAVLPSQLAG